MGKIVTLKKRAEFLRLRGGSRWATSRLVLETKPAEPARKAAPTKSAAPRSGAGQVSGVTDTGDGGAASPPPRFGFTVTRQIGNAVVRNRIRRRLRSIVADLPPGLARPGFDYVIVVRQGAVTCPFDELAKDLEQGFHRVHHPQPARRRST